jgi:hypothetical protein
LQNATRSEVSLPNGDVGEMSIPVQSVQEAETPSRSRTIWFVLSVLFTIGNVIGGIFAARNGEFAHAGVHALLTFFGGQAAWRLAPGRFSRGVAVDDVSALQPAYGDLGDRLLRMEQAVESIAIEVERVGEGQRFLTRLHSERDAHARADALAAKKPPSS